MKYDFNIVRCFLVLYQTAFSASSSSTGRSHPFQSMHDAKRGQAKQIIGHASSGPTPEGKPLGG
jgi:hypothetical protein